MAKSSTTLWAALGSIVREIDFLSITIIIIFGIATSVTQHHDPVLRPVFMYDATISYKYMADHDFPFWLALLVPFVVLAATAIAVEYVYQKQGWKRSTAAFLNVLLTALAAIAVVGFLTELFKRICGRVRPDFLSRCQPETVNGIIYQYGQYPNIKCKEDNNLDDGRMSFPSGHSSCSMSFGLFSALYLLWCVFYRDNGAVSKSLVESAARSWLGKLKGDLISVLLVLVVLFDIAWPWGIAASRFIDNRHNVSDVVAGLLLAVCFVPVFIVRLASNCKQWTHHYAKVAAEQSRVLPVTHSQVERHLNHMHNLVDNMSNGSQMVNGTHVIELVGNSSKDSHTIVSASGAAW